MLKRLKSNLPTRDTSSNDLEESLTDLTNSYDLTNSIITEGNPSMLHFSILVKADSFSLMCLGHMPRYQSSSPAFKHTYKIISQTFPALMSNLGPMLVVTIICGLDPFGT